jgi:hypothetical protein
MTNLNDLAVHVAGLSGPCPTCGHYALPDLDWPAFAEQLRVAMAKGNLSLRQAAAEIGVDQATLHRAAKHAKPPAADNYRLIVKWLRARAVGRGV